MSKKSVKTTAASLVAALAIILSALSEALKDGWSAQDVTMIVGAVGIAIGGFFSRDDDVTSEGTKAPR